MVIIWNLYHDHTYQWSMVTCYFTYGSLWLLNNGCCMLLPWMLLLNHCKHSFVAVAVRQQQQGGGASGPAAGSGVPQAIQKATQDSEGEIPEMVHGKTGPQETLIIAG